MNSWVVGIFLLLVFSSSNIVTGMLEGSLVNVQNSLAQLKGKLEDLKKKIDDLSVKLTSPVGGAGALNKPVAVPFVFAKLELGDDKISQLKVRMYGDRDPSTIMSGITFFKDLYLKIDDGALKGDLGFEEINSVGYDTIYNSNLLEHMFKHGDESFCSELKRASWRRRFFDVVFLHQCRLRFEGVKNKNLTYVSVGSGELSQDFKLLDFLALAGFTFEKIIFIEHKLEQVKKALPAFLGWFGSQYQDAFRDTKFFVYKDSSEYKQDCFNDASMKADILVAVDVHFFDDYKIEEKSPNYHGFSEFKNLVTKTLKESGIFFALMPYMGMLAKSGKPYVIGIFPLGSPKRSVVAIGESKGSFHYFNLISGFDPKSLAGSKQINSGYSIEKYVEGLFKAIASQKDIGETMVITLPKSKVKKLWEQGHLDNYYIS